MLFVGFLLHEKRFRKASNKQGMLFDVTILNLLSSWPLVLANAHPKTKDPGKPKALKKTRRSLGFCRTGCCVDFCCFLGEIDLVVSRLSMVLFWVFLVGSKELFLFAWAAFDSGLFFAGQRTTARDKLSLSFSNDERQAAYLPKYPRIIP